MFRRGRAREFSEHFARLRGQITGMMMVLRQFAVLIFALAPLMARAGGDEVVVIYNSRLPESKAVADYYARARQVPASQVFGFALTTNEVMTRPEFADSLQTPLARRLESSGLWQFNSFTNAATNGRPERVLRRVTASKIRYAVLCYGVPLKIETDPNWPGNGNTNSPSQFRRNEAAVDSELAWLPEIAMKPPLDGPLRKPRLRRHQHRVAQSHQRHSAGHAAGRPQRRHRARPGGQGAARRSATACGGAPISMRAG